MSYGWLTESALIPQPAKKIKVENSSILDLQAIIQKGKQQQKPKSKINKNKGIELRNQKDMDELNRTSQIKISQTLEEKAKLYDKCINNQIQSKNYLVDFQQKFEDDQTKEDKDNYEQLRNQFYNEKKDFLVKQEQKYLQIEKNNFNKDQIDNEINRLQWERQMYDQIQDGMTEQELQKEKSNLVKQVYDKKFTQDEKQAIQQVVQEVKIEKDEIIDIRKKKEDQKNQRKLKLLNLL